MSYKCNMSDRRSIQSSLLLLKLLGTEPILPVILNPLSITLALPRSLSIGKLRWSRVILFCLLLSVLGEAQRTSVAAGLAWLKFKKRACRSVHVGQVELGGKSLPIRDGDDDDDDDDEIEESCVICSGGSADALSDSVSSITSLASHAGPSSRPGPLETFCTHAPTKHPMHRSCVHQALHASLFPKLMCFSQMFYSMEGCLLGRAHL